MILCDTKIVIEILHGRRVYITLFLYIEMNKLLNNLMFAKISKTNVDYDLFIYFKLFSSNNIKNSRRFSCATLLRVNPFRCSEILNITPSYLSPFVFHLFCHLRIDFGSNLVRGNFAVGSVCFQYPPLLSSRAIGNYSGRHTELVRDGDSNNIM